MKSPVGQASLSVAHPINWCVRRTLRKTFQGRAGPLKSLDPSACQALELRINMAGAATFRCVAGDIQKLAFLVTTGTLFRGPGGADRKIALAASPISQVALRADISGELAGSGEAAQGTFPFLFLGRHQSHLLFSLSWIIDPNQPFFIKSYKVKIRWRYRVVKEGKIWLQKGCLGHRVLSSNSA